MQKRKFFVRLGYLFQFFGNKSQRSFDKRLYKCFEDFDASLVFAFGDEATEGSVVRQQS